MHHIIILLITTLLLSSSPTVAKTSHTTSNGLPTTPINVELAFKLQTEQKADKLILNWQIAHNYFLYKDKIKLTDLSNSIDLTNKLVFPKHIILEDKILGENLAVYGNDLKLELDINDNIDMIKISYQGCSAGGFCYAPQYRIIAIANDTNNLSSGNNKIKSNSLSHDPIDTSIQTTSISKHVSVLMNNNQNYFTNLVADQSYVKVIIAFLVFGLLLAFTPCVLPMLPIILSIVVGRTDLVSKTRAFMLTFVYVLAMATTYAIIGILAGILGQNLQITLQKPTVIVVVSIFIGILGLHMLEFFQINSPININKQIYRLEKKQGHGSMLNAAVLGILATLVITPCITPALAGVVTFLAEQGSPVKGGIVLFFMGVGIGLPLIIFAVGGSHFLPKTGSWSKTIKKLTGFIILGLAIWLLERIVNAPTAIILWGILAICLAIFIHKTGVNKYNTNNPSVLRSILKILFFIYGVILIIGSLMNFENSLLNPFGNILERKINNTNNDVRINNESYKSMLTWYKVTNTQELDEKIELGISGNKKSMLFYSAKWCVACDIIKTRVLTNPEIIKALSSYNLIDIYFAEHTQDTKELMQRYNVFGVPTIIFLDQNGLELPEAKIIGNVSIEGLLAVFHLLPPY